MCLNPILLAYHQARSAMCMKSAASTASICHTARMTLVHLRSLEGANFATLYRRRKPPDVLSLFCGDPRLQHRVMQAYGLFLPFPDVGRRTRSGTSPRGSMEMINPHRSSSYARGPSQWQTLPRHRSYVRLTLLHAARPTQPVWTNASDTWQLSWLRYNIVRQI